MSTLKKYLLFIAFILFCQLTSAQSQELQQFNQTRLQINKTGMLTLGSWALGNIGTAALLLGKSSGSNKYFYQMNLYWNVVNLTLAGFGYHGAVSSNAGSYNLFNSIKEQYSMEKILLFNAGLDIGYILGGLYLSERSKNNPSRADMLKGFGQSIIFQGSFLFLFDLSMYFIHHGNESKLKNILDQVSFNGNNLQVMFTF